MLGDADTVILHMPIAGVGHDPLPVAQDARVLLCQIYFADERALASPRIKTGIAASLAKVAKAEGIHDVHTHVMTSERLKVGSPDDKSACAEAVSFFVQYDGPAEDQAAFHAYYRAHHVPIVFRMPGIRSVTYHLPMRIEPPVIGHAVERLQIVQAVFDSADDFVTMRQSAQRKEGLRDFSNYPKFEGPVTHQVMHSIRLD